MYKQNIIINSIKIDFSFKLPIEIVVFTCNSFTATDVHMRSEKNKYYPRVIE